MERYKLFIDSPSSARSSLSPTNTASNSPKSLSPGQSSKKPSLGSVKLPQITPKKRHLTEPKPLSIKPAYANTSSCGIIHSYAVNSHKGQRHYEDRIKIITNIKNPATVSEENWPKSSVFALFDGQYGSECAEYLKLKLCDEIFTNQNYPFRIKEAFKDSFSKLDQEFLNIAKKKKNVSGACALVLLIVGDKCFVANCGDSKALISLNGGKMVTALNSQHNTSNPDEQNRVLQSGGKLTNAYIKDNQGQNIKVGSSKILPGRLKVTRSFGHIDAKLPEYEGNPGVLLSSPEIKSFKIRPEQDFIVVASASVYKKLSNVEVVQIILNNLSNKEENQVDKGLVLAIDQIFREAIKRGCEDNMTVVIVVLKGIKKFFQGKIG